jgi:excisionase family DNA binding protein
MAETETDRGYLDLTGLSEYSSIGKSTLRQHIKMGNLPAYKVGGKIFVKRETFDAWVEHQSYESDDLSGLVDGVMDELRS